MGVAEARAPHNSGREFFSGTYCVKFGNFVNFLCAHIKFGNFDNSSDKFRENSGILLIFHTYIFGQKCFPPQSWLSCSACASTKKWGWYCFQYCLFVCMHACLSVNTVTYEIFGASSYVRKGRQVPKWLYRGARVVIIHLWCSSSSL